MKSAKELRKERRKLLASMKEAGIRRTSCMNRVDEQTYRCNLRLAEIKAELEGTVTR